MGYICDVKWFLFSTTPRKMSTCSDTEYLFMYIFNLFRNSTYCMKVSMSMTVEESDEGKCFSSKIRHLEKAEITHSKMIHCPDIEDYLAPYKQPQMTWYKVWHERRKVFMSLLFKVATDLFCLCLLLGV